MKRLFAIFLVLSMLLALCPMYSFADITTDYINGIMGSAPTDPAAKFEVAVSDNYYSSGESITVTVTVKDVAMVDGLFAVGVTFFYSDSVLTLTNTIDTEGVIDCVTNAPSQEWYDENFCKVNSDGSICLSAMGNTESEGILMDDGGLVFTLTFDVAEGCNEDIFFAVSHNGCEVMQVGAYYAALAEGSYAIVEASPCDKNGHTPGKEADCENNQVCTVCGDVIVSSYGHNYISVITPATCTDEGYTTHTCSNCGDEYVTDKVDPLGHTEGSEADCENGQFCTVCGTELVPALGHIEGEWVTLDDGSQELRCEVCGELLDSKPASTVTYPVGDVNGDGKLNMFDYMKVKSFYFGIAALSAEEYMRADLTGDNNVNMFDYMKIKSLVFANK